MVHGVAKRHDATLEIDSEVGKGTTFRLGFAVADAPTKADDAPAENSTAVNSLRVLLVDDDPIVLEVMQFALLQEGHSVVSANGGKEAVTAFEEAFGKSEPINVVITDLGMPNMNGLEVAKAVKAISQSTPVILLSGWGRRMDANDEASSNLDFILCKPPRMPELRAALQGCARIADCA
jgi:CheY-like chemotaxis protein